MEQIHYKDSLHFVRRKNRILLHIQHNNDLVDNNYLDIEILHVDKVDKVDNHHNPKELYTPPHNKLQDNHNLRLLHNHYKKNIHIWNCRLSIRLPIENIVAQTLLRNYYLHSKHQR